MKNISVFLSSTFNDMQSERDVIREHIAPEIEEEFKKYGYHVEFIDLRWGIDTKDMAEADASRKILQTCFDEIQNCKPFFLAFLGERYGWVPDRDDILYALDGNALDISREELEKSVTELEIECALNTFPRTDRCLFYFREPVNYGDDASAREAFVSEGREERKLQALKERIRTRYCGRIRSYTAAWDATGQRIEGLEGFERSVLSEIRAALLEELTVSERPTSRIEESINVTESLIGGLARSFSGRSREQAAFCDFLDSPDRRLLVLRGNSGCGKSSLLAKLISTREAAGDCVLPFFTGADEFSSSAENMMRVIVHRFAVLSGTEPPSGLETLDAKELFAMFNAALNRLAAERKVVLVVDAVNQFVKTPYENKVAWLNPYALNPSVKIILSVTSDYDQMKFLISCGAEFYDLDYFSAEDVGEIAKHYFAVNHRQINGTLLHEIVTKGGEKAPCREPVYLLTLLQALNSIDRDDFRRIKERERTGGEAAGDAILSYLTDLVRTAPVERGELFGQFLGNAAQKLGEEVCHTFVTAIAVSRRGMSEQFLERVCTRIGVRFEGASFSYFRKLFKNHLLQRENGCWDFNHALIKEYFYSTVGAERRAAIMDAIIACLEEERDDSPFKRAEYAYYLAKSDRLEAFAPYLARMRGDGEVIRSLTAELQLLGREYKRAEKLLLPEGEARAAAIEFMIETVGDGLYRFEDGENYALLVLNCIYAEGTPQGKALCNVYRLYAALGKTAEKAGYVALAKDYDLIALKLAKEQREGLSALYAHLTECYFRLGKGIKSAKYRRLGEKAREEDFEKDGSEISARALLETCYGGAMLRTQALFLGKKHLLAYVKKMQAVLSQANFGGEERALWASRILEIASNVAPAAELCTAEAELCSHFVQTADDRLLRAEVGLRLALYLSDYDLSRARAVAEDAYASVKHALKSNNDADTNDVYRRILELKSVFARAAGKDVAGFRAEQAACLRRLNLLRPSYSTVQEELAVLPRREKERKEEARRLRKQVSRGQQSAEQRAVNKILLVIVASVLAVYLIAMPLFFSVFRGYAGRIFSVSSNNMFRLFINFYFVASFESFFNLFLCFGAYGLLQIVRPDTGYLARRSWLKRSLILLAVCVVMLVAYSCLWNYFYDVMVIEDDYVTYETPYMMLLSSGLLLLMLALHEGMLLVSRERRVLPRHRDYTRFIAEYPQKMIGYLWDALFLIAIILIYYFTAQNYVSYGNVLTDSAGPFLVLRRTWFWILSGILGAFIAAKAARLTVLYFIGRKRYAKMLAD